jgi:hypothetical protein
MTRINCVPPSELTDKHLLAEYRELPRLFALTRAWYDRDGDYSSLPKVYTMGKGHVKFFYDKSLWLFMRQCQLYDECYDRGFRVTRRPNMIDSFWDGPRRSWNDWTPTPEALAINRARIKERLS